MKSVLIANRGEIAVRIARTLRELGIESVGLYTERDRSSLHTCSVDRALPLESELGYLDMQQIVALGARAGCDAVHPGYGFLSENADFAEACTRAGLTFIGPPASAIRAMGSKQNARKAMLEAGVPVVPGGDASSLEQARSSARSVGYPILVKATDGGGGKGMRLVASEAELLPALERTRSEAKSAFGSDSVYIEKAIFSARHVEVQVLGDRAGTLLHLYERDCSIQRRHQKIIEETPCPVLAEHTLSAMTDVALRGAAAIGYHSAGTFEFLLGPDGAFYFLEMNTRLQVEHPITELVTGVDLVREMIHVAQGRPLAIQPISRRGAAIEARIYAERPEAGFLPSPGRISAITEAGGPFVRSDSGVYPGAEVSDRYDPLLAKLSVWAPDREQALRRMRRALWEYSVQGVATNLAFLGRLLEHDAFLRGEYDTRFVEREIDKLTAARELSHADAEQVACAAAVAAHLTRTAGPEAASAASETSAWVRAQRSTLGR